MHIIGAVIAQVATDAVAGNPLYNYGISGLMLSWFMWRYEKHSAALLSEIRRVTHRQLGLEMSHWADIATRPDCPPIIRKHAEDEVHRYNKGEKT